MLMNRIIYIILLIASFIFSSFYGGYIPELIRYSLILMPVFLFAYVCVIYLRMKAGQRISDDTAVRGQELDYYLNIDNPDIMPYMNLELSYYEGVADMEINDGTDNISIMSREHRSYEGKIICRYAGTYNVGVKAIYISDYLGIFRLRYRLRRQIRVHVRPEELDIYNIRSVLYGGSSNKNINESNNAGSDTIGSNVRDYVPGDSPRRIHWKNTAKLGRLVTRQGEEDYDVSTFLIIDTGLTGYSFMDRIIMTDRILHIAVAVARGYMYKSVRYEILYSNDNSIHSYSVNTEEDYRRFYYNCENINFTVPDGVESVISDISAGHAGYPVNYVIVTGRCSNGRAQSYERVMKNKSTFTIINVIFSEEEELSGNGMYDVINVNVSDDICEVLSE